MKGVKEEIIQRSRSRVVFITFGRDCLVRLEGCNETFVSVRNSLEELWV